MPLSRFQPEQASGTEIAEWREVLNEMTAADMPDEPRWQSERLRDYLSVTLPGEQRLAFASRDDTGRMTGHANLLLFGGDYRDTGIFEIFVRPDSRGTGVGRALLSSVARAAAEAGCSTIGVEVIATTPAVSFYDRLGFDRAVVEERHLLKTADVDWPAVHGHADHLAAGYRLEYHSGELPEDMLERYAATKANLRTGPDTTGIGEWRGSADAERLRSSLATLRRRGMRSHLVVAVAEPSGAVAGLTELVVAATRPTRGDQYDTAIAPAHRSYGLGLAMKARMLCELREAEPQLVDVQTWAAKQNDPMERVNAELGFRHDVDWYEYEASVPELLRRLGLGADEARTSA